MPQAKKQQSLARMDAFAVKAGCQWNADAREEDRTNPGY